MRPKTAENQHDFSLDAIWQACQRTRLLDVESSLTSTMWPRWGPLGIARIQTSASGKCEAGIDRSIFIGQYYDASGLSYLNARYYNGSQGQFTSQDPVFLGNPSQQHLQNPQSLNSYSYSEDNPITKEDPNGRGVFEGSFSAGYILAGGEINFDFDTDSLQGQLSAGPFIGPNIGGHLSASYSPDASLDASGLYYQTSIGGAYVLGASFSAETPINASDPRNLIKAGQSSGGWSINAGLSIGATDGLLYKGQPFNTGWVGSTYNSFSNFMNTSLASNFSSSSGGGNGSQLSYSVVSYASNPNANLSDTNFAAALKSINLASAPWLTSSSVSTPAVAKK